MLCNVIYTFIHCEPINGYEREKWRPSHYLKMTMNLLASVEYHTNYWHNL